MCSAHRWFRVFRFCWKFCKSNNMKYPCDEWRVEFGSEKKEIRSERLTIIMKLWNIQWLGGWKIRLKRIAMEHKTSFIEYATCDEFFYADLAKTLFIKHRILSTYYWPKLSPFSFIVPVAASLRCLLLFSTFFLLFSRTRCWQLWLTVSETKYSNFNWETTGKFLKFWFCLHSTRHMRCQNLWDWRILRFALFFVSVTFLFNYFLHPKFF